MFVTTPSRLFSSCSREIKFKVNDEEFDIEVRISEALNNNIKQYLSPDSVIFNIDTDTEFDFLNVSGEELKAAIQEALFPFLKDEYINLEEKNRKNALIYIFNKWKSTDLLRNLVHYFKIEERVPQEYIDFNDEDFYLTINGEKYRTKRRVARDLSNNIYMLMESENIDSFYFKNDAIKVNPKVMRAILGQDKGYNVKITPSNAKDILTISAILENYQFFNCALMQLDKTDPLKNVEYIQFLMNEGLYINFDVNIQLVEVATKELLAVAHGDLLEKILNCPSTRLSNKEEDLKSFAELASNEVELFNTRAIQNLPEDYIYYALEKIKPQDFSKASWENLLKALKQYN